MSQQQSGRGLTYADTGVDITAGNALVERIKPMVAATHRPGVLGGLGGFGGLFELPLDRYRHPVMVSGTDGVGTKLRLAIDCNRHEGIGQDLVAMCVNDILVCGAEPLWFLDYFASAKLDVDRAAIVIDSIARGCTMAGAALLGGETAEMPGHYQGEDYDLAGFAVGIVEKQAIIDGHDTRPGDTLIGLASSGPHSNGFSLIRAIVAGHDLQQPIPVSPGAVATGAGDTGNTTLAEALLAPTRIYVQSLLDTLHRFPVRAMAHITGGGLLENIPRSLPDGLIARIRRDAWQQPAVFDWLQRTGDIDDTEFLRTFNAGIGWFMVVPANTAEPVMAHLTRLGEQPVLLGEIVASHDSHAAAALDIIR